MNQALEYAYSLGIIDVCPFQDGYIKRKDAAKMISLFATQALDMQPSTGKACRFSDIGNESEVLQAYMKLSCQL
jgi:hypothetical protein